jgi:three-Cys-motif partner protein
MKEFLFDDMPPENPQEAKRTFRQLDHHIWTESKANLIQHYLQGFVFVTHHGTYIDGFAGPQNPNKHKMWAAKLVVESRPRWLRHFFFFEQDQSKVKTLERMTSTQPQRAKNEPKRTFKTYPGDFNSNIHQMLSEFPVPDQEAAFCLLDQRTFECKWSSVQAVATHKRGGNKIELFYFLANSWMDRSISGLNDPEGEMKKWWGDATWKKLIERRGIERGLYLAERFKTEFGYKYAYPFPIFGRKDGGKMMYFMVHASDHPDATPIMFRAYKKSVGGNPIRLAQPELIARPL